MEKAKTECLKFLETFKLEKEITRDLLIEVARTSLIYRKILKLSILICKITHKM